MPKSLVTVPTEFVTAGETKFAYRRIGSGGSLPLICFQHFSGTMDSWDPSVIDGLSKERQVVVFDNAGIGGSSGTSASSVAEMAAAAKAFILAIGRGPVDILGYSLGGMIAQLLAVSEPALIRKVILVGTAPQGGEEHLVAVLREARSHNEAPDVRLPLFFTSSAESQAAGQAFVARARARKHDRDPESGPAIMSQHTKAIVDWCATADPAHRSLTSLSQATLVVSGRDDTMLPASNAYVIFQNIARAQLILYPDAGHGALFQYPERFIRHVTPFLDE